MGQKNLAGEEAEVPLDLVMWVGGSYYTIESYIKEANRFGCCKRIAGLPQDIVVGKSRVFLVHDVSDWDRRQKKKGLPRLFGYFTINGILVVGAEELMKKEGVQVISASAAASFEERGCGMLVVGGTYLVSDEDIAKLQKHADMAKGQLKFIDPRKPVNLPRFRGYRYIRGDKVLAGANQDEWFQVQDIRKANLVLRKPPMQRVKYGSTREERIKYIKRRTQELAFSHLSLLRKRQIIREEVRELFGLKRKTADWLVWSTVTD